MESAKKECRLCAALFCYDGNNSSNSCDRENMSES